MKSKNNLPWAPCFIVMCILLCAGGCHKSFDSVPPATQLSSESNAVQIASSKTNIILIVADDLGYEIPSYTGGESYSTPNLDFMAANGMQFPNFYPHPDGPPTRLALVTGKYNFRNWQYFGFLSTDEKCIGNMLRDANYSTCYAGKWQLDGGDTSIRKHGFENYLTFVPFNPAANNGHDQMYRRYKNPYLYAKGAFLSDSAVKGKYSEDMFFDYASNFIDSNLTKPFFLLYSFNLVQKPWSPTPDNPDFATWDPAVDDVTKHKEYFPDMVNYLDKIIGKIINKVQSVGLSNKTVIIFTSDNATNSEISSLYKGQTFTGGKSSTSMKGLKVPMVVYWPGTISPGTIDTSLADVTDILPTFANIAKITKPTTWGKLDGLTLYDNLTGSLEEKKQRNFVYCFWPKYYKHDWDISFVYNYNYKLYDSTTAVNMGGDFYNIKTDPDEEHPLNHNQLTPSEKTINQKFKKILDSAMAQKQD